MLVKNKARFCITWPYIDGAVLIIDSIYDLRANFNTITKFSLS